MSNDSSTTTTNNNKSPVHFVAKSEPRRRQPPSHHISSVAIVGGGIAGACAAAELAQLVGVAAANDNTKDHHPLSITVLDQGRRGPGGRASHRSVRACDKRLIVTEDQRRQEAETGGSIWEFDHGCQFFRADSQLMQNYLLPKWLAKKLVAPWNDTARLGYIMVAPQNNNDTTTNDDGRGADSARQVNGESPSTKHCHTDNDNDNDDDISLDPVDDFFGIPSTFLQGQRNPQPLLYIGVDGMNQLPRNILNEAGTTQGTANVDVLEGTRVCRVEWNADFQQWQLLGTSGDAAYHDSTTGVEEEEATPRLLCRADAVIFTDISSASDSWHRASAGIPEALRQQLPEKLRLPLFSCMFTLQYASSSTAGRIPLDGFTIQSNPSSNEERSILWFCSRSQSKPGFENQKDKTTFESWTLVSTPAFAVAKIQETAMRDPETGAFRPQEDDYLKSVPGKELYEAFVVQVLQQYYKKEELPVIRYLQAQRWGSGLPLSPHMASEIHEIVEDRFVSKLQTPLVRSQSEKESNSKHYLADDNLRLYYAGDFVSEWRNPGFEAAALSGVHVARHILQTIKAEQQ